MEVYGEFWPVLATTFGTFLLVGFVAQLIDGAVGMAYGVISSSVLLAFGVPPAQVSATIHAAECFTTGASGASHLVHRNIDWKLFWRLAPAGVVGARERAGDRDLGRVGRGAESAREIVLTSANDIGGREVTEGNRGRFPSVR